MSIRFFTEDIDFHLDKEEKHINWINEIGKSFKVNIEELNYIFCSDDYLLKINQDHLDHDYYTDIITFDNSDTENQVEGDIFISIDRVKENAKELSTGFSNELSRVIAHGLLHLIGFKDKTTDEQRVMREKEEACLSLQKH